MYEISPSSVFFLRCVLKYLSKGSVSEKDLRNAVVTECRIAGVRVNSRGGLTGSNIDVSIICGVLQTLGVLDEEKRTSIWALRRERMAAAQALASKSPSTGHIPGYPIISGTIPSGSGTHILASSSSASASATGDSADSNDGSEESGEAKSASDPSKPDPFEYATKNLSEISCDIDKAILERFGDLLATFLDTLARKKRDTPSSSTPRGGGDKSAMDFDSVMLDGSEFLQNDVKLEETLDGDASNAMDVCGANESSDPSPTGSQPAQQASPQGAAEVAGTSDSSSDVYNNAELDSRDSKRVKIEPIPPATVPASAMLVANASTTSVVAHVQPSMPPPASVATISVTPTPSATLPVVVPPSSATSMPQVAHPQPVAMSAAPLPTATMTNAQAVAMANPPPMPMQHFPNVAMNNATTMGVSAPPTAANLTSPTFAGTAASYMATAAAGPISMSAVPPSSGGIATMATSNLMGAGAVPAGAITKPPDAAALREALALLDSCKGVIKKPVPIASTSALYDSYKTKYGVDKDLVSEALRAITSSAAAAAAAATAASVGATSATPSTVAGGMPSNVNINQIAYPQHAPGAPNHLMPGSHGGANLAAAVGNIGSFSQGMMSSMAMPSSLLMHSGPNYGMTHLAGAPPSMSAGTMSQGAMNSGGNSLLINAANKGGRKPRKAGDIGPDLMDTSGLDDDYKGGKDGKKGANANGGAGVGNGSRVWRMREDMQRVFANPFDFIKSYADVCYTEQLALEYEEILLRQLAGECEIEIPHNFVRTGTTYLKPTFAYGETDEPFEEEEVVQPEVVEVEEKPPKPVEKKVEMHALNIIFGANESSTAEITADVLIDRYRHLQSHPKELTSMLQKLATKKWELPEVFEMIPLSQKSRTKSVGYSTPLVDLQFSGGASNISSLIEHSRVRSVPPPSTSMDMLTLKRNPNPLNLLHNRYVPPTPFELATWRSVQKKNLENAGFGSYVIEGKPSKAKKSSSKKSKDGKSSGSATPSDSAKADVDEDAEVTTSIYIPDTQSSHPRFMCIPDLVIRTQPMEWLELASEFAPLESNAATPGGGLGTAGGLPIQSPVSLVSTPTAVAVSRFNSNSRMEDESDVDGDARSDNAMDTEEGRDESAMDQSTSDHDGGVDGLGELPVAASSSSTSAGLRRVISSNSIASSLSSGSHQQSALISTPVVNESAAGDAATAIKRRRRRNRLTIQLPENPTGTGATVSIESSAKKYAAVQSPSFKIVQSPFGTVDLSASTEGIIPPASPRAPSASESEGEEDVSDAAYSRRHEEALGRMMAKWNEIQAERKARREARKMERLIQSGAAVATANGTIVPIVAPKRSGSSSKTPSSSKSHAKHAVPLTPTAAGVAGISNTPSSAATPSAFTPSEGVSTRRKAVQSFSASLGNTNNGTTAHPPLSPTASTAGAAGAGLVSTPNSVSSKSSAYSSVAPIGTSLALSRERRSSKR